jgi:hypothetical protein
VHITLVVLMNNSHEMKFNFPDCNDLKFSCTLPRNVQFMVVLLLEK